MSPARLEYGVVLLKNVFRTAVTAVDIGQSVHTLYRFTLLDPMPFLDDSLVLIKSCHCKICGRLHSD